VAVAGLGEAQGDGGDGLVRRALAHHARHQVARVLVPGAGGDLGTRCAGAFGAAAPLKSRLSEGPRALIASSSHSGASAISFSSGGFSHS
jgi:hypothetical protein